MASRTEQPLQRSHVLGQHLHRLHERGVLRFQGDDARSLLADQGEARGGRLTAGAGYTDDGRRVFLKNASPLDPVFGAGVRRRQRAGGDTIALRGFLHARGGFSAAGLLGYACAMMDLMRCSSCGGTVSRRAAACPACGCPTAGAPPPFVVQNNITNKVESKGSGCGCGAALLILLVLLVAGFSAWRTMGNNVVGRITTSQ